MKKFNLLKFIAAPTIVGLMLSLSFCKKDTETITNNLITHDTVKTVLKDTIRINDTLYLSVHDTATGKTLSGVATYPDFSNTQTTAKGAVVVLYSGSAINPSTVVGYTFTNASGAYSFPYLIPGSYYVYAKYNTTNANARAIEGINFVTNPGYPVTISINTTQNLNLVSLTPTGSARISFLPKGDSIPGYRLVTFETHSKIGFNFLNIGGLALIEGGFNKFQMDSNFVFDEANPANTVISGYTVLSSITTYEPTRDALGTGCVHKTLDADIDSAVFKSNGTYVPLAITDTARFVCTAGHVERYGDGYVAHGTLTAFYKHGLSDAYPPDTTAGYNGPFDQMITKSIDMYFNYDKQKVSTGANFNWWFVFEGQFSFKPQTDFYLVSSHFQDGPINVTVHTEFQGKTNVEY